MPESRMRKTAAPRPASVGRSSAPGKQRVARAPGGLETLQRLAGNRTVSGLVGANVQRLLDGFYGDGETKVPASRISLTAPFKKKHVADDETKARQVTGARIEEGKPAAMVNGRLGNTVATEAAWLEAIDKSTATIPDQNAWQGGLPVKLTGWDAKRTGPRSITVSPLADAARTVGGYMKKKGGAVEIDHVSGQT
jgi:hypothetical protein